MLQNVGAENAIGFRVGHELDHSIDILIRKRPAISAEGKFADAVVEPLLFHLLFSQTNACQRRIGVNDFGNRVLIYMSRLASNKLDPCTTFFREFGIEELARHYAVYNL